MHQRIDNRHLRGLSIPFLIFFGCLWWNIHSSPLKQSYFKDVYLLNFLLNVYRYTLDFSWELVRLICANERFDAYWPFMAKREQAVLKTISVGQQSDDTLLEQQFEQLPELRFWYETDMETPPIIKCAVFCAVYGYQFAPALLRKQGYEWAAYIDVRPLFENLPDGITEQVIFFLTVLRDAQEHILKIVQIKGVEQTLTAKEKQLLHVIEHNPGIKTTALSKKLGVSTSTTKRMTDRLITANLIARVGIGRGSHYTLL